MSQGPFLTKKGKAQLDLSNGKPKLSSDGGCGSFLLSLVRKTGPFGGYCENLYARFSKSTTPDQTNMKFCLFYIFDLPWAMQ